MGKKEKKKKGLGKAKTEAKAAKKAEKASRKARAADGEDVEAILAEILDEEAKSVAVAEHQDVPPPCPRTSFTLVANPITENELIQFGGERYTGNISTFFNDLYVFNVDKKRWTRYESPNRPPPRSSHAAAVHRNMMYIFGGEFSNPSLSQYRHYRDLWRLDLSDMNWERIETRGGPTARSGHRMCVVDNKLVVFGGFFDTGFENRYLDDMYVMDLSLDDLKWNRIEFQSFDVLPSPRSGFQWVVHGTDVFMYGGYYKKPAEKAKNISHKGKKKGGNIAEESLAAEGMCLSDWYKWCVKTMKWQKVKRAGYGPSRRAGFSMVLHKQNAVLFGGVEDTECDDDLQSIFFNDLFAFNLDRKKFFPMTLRKKKGKKSKKAKTTPSENSDPIKGPDSDEKEESSTKDVTSEDGQSASQIDEEGDGKDIDTEALTAALMQEEELRPCSRFNSAVAVLKNMLYIVGGVVEKGDREITLDDIWAIDLNKLDEFHEIKELSEACSEWIASDGEDSADEEDEDDTDGDEDDSEDDENEEKVERRRGRLQKLRQRTNQADDANFTPLINESLKDFFDRTKNYWIGEVHEALGESGKTLRRVAFEWAFKRYWEVKPTLKELEELEAELAAEAEKEKQYAEAQRQKQRGRLRK